MENIYFNYYSVSSLICFCMTTVLTIFLLQLPKKSRATLVLGLSFACLVFWNLAYTVAAAYYHPDAAFHRWVTVLFSSLISPLLARFFFAHPRDTHRRLANIYVYSHVSLSLIVTGYFVFRTLQPETGFYYHFDGDYWDNDQDGLSALVARYLILSNIIFWCVGFWRAFSLRGYARWALALMVATVMFSSLAQGITNLLSRDGAMDRSVFQTVYGLSVVLGFFALVVIFINTTRDRTTFMTKIVGISLTTLLTVLQGIAYFTLQDSEKAYDVLHRTRMDLFLALGRKDAPEDMVYLRSFDPALDAAEMSYEKRPTGIDFAAHRTAMLNTVFRERLARLLAGEESTEALLAGAHPFAAGYLRALEPILGRVGSGEAGVAGLNAYFSANERKIRQQYSKIRKLPRAGFREALYEYIEGNGRKEPFSHFAEQIQNYATANPDLPDEDLRAAALNFLAPMQAAGVRLNRRSRAEDPREEMHYLAFEKYDHDAGRLIEAGFDYRAYREYIQEAAGRLAWMVLAVLFVVVVGFQFFFHGALVSPLRTLLGGVRKVDEGDLSVRVPVQVEDEIGQLTGYFNKMVDSIREAREALQEYADGLEEKVRQRTAELSQTLEEVQSLKSQQDGDYFLTSLLMRPLSANRAKSENVSVDTLVRQKKQFTFRKWDEEIGGDCCSTYNIRLNKKRYTVYLNADAMGKSMQGAGGVLVLGAVFESIVDRTLLSAQARNIYPERWIKNTFIELHKIFEGFDGSMLISLVMGLVDEESGLMYYINAEHPWTVLYRNDKAEFIEEDLDFRKLGTTGLDGGQIYIRTFQLEPGDVIIAGSDGRDDILLSTKDGERVLNTDEHAFLRHVEAGRGDLELIHDELLKMGPLTDDLSLLRLAFKEDHPLADESTPEKVDHLLERARNALKSGDAKTAAGVLEEARALDDHNRRVIKLQVKVYTDLKDYEKAAAAAEDYTYIAPGETEFVFLTSFCYKKIGRLDDAADFGERVRLREPDNARNLMNLADIYARMKNYKRAESMVDDLLRVEPDHEKGLAMKSKLKELAAGAL